jgi:uncharacterized membrane protein (DUF106 family)
MMMIVIIVMLFSIQPEKSSRKKGINILLITLIAYPSYVIIFLFMAIIVVLYYSIFTKLLSDYTLLA